MIKKVSSNKLPKLKPYKGNCWPLCDMISRDKKENKQTNKQTNKQIKFGRTLSSLRAKSEIETREGETSRPAVERVHGAIATVD